MTVLIDNRSNQEISPNYLETIEKVAAASLAYEDFESDCEISVSIVTNEEIQSINKEFRDIDKATDVLSFPQLSFCDDEVAGVNENNEIILGDIIISLERANEQAQEYGHSLKREIAFLTAHSMLHLLGYDHMAAEEEAQMNKKQKEILDSVGITRENVSGDGMENSKLVQLAVDAMEYAYAPYSHFCVGAALLCEDGRVFTGCNIENASYGATCCAERTAIFKAVSEGVRRFEKIAIVGSGGDFTPPCGICRQVLFEFMKDGYVILANAKGDYQTHKVADLLPFGFSLESN